MSKSDLKEVFKHLDEELVWRLKNVLTEMWESETLYHEVDELGYPLDDVWDKWNTPLLNKFYDFLYEFDESLDLTKEG